MKILLKTKRNEQRRRRAQGQRVTKVAWEQAGRNRGLDFKPQEKRVMDDEWTQTHTGTRMEDVTL